MGPIKIQLVQRRFPGATYILTVSEASVSVQVKTWTTTRSQEIPLSELSTSVASYRHFPLQLFIFAGALMVFCGLVAMLRFMDPLYKGDFGLPALMGILAVLSTILILEGFRRKEDLIGLVGREGENVKFFMRRTAPSERHVTEFLEILIEEIRRAESNDRAKEA